MDETMRGNRMGSMLLSAVMIVSLACFNELSASPELSRPCNSSCILVAAIDRIMALDYDNNWSFSVISNLSLALAVDYHYNLGYIFWCDRNAQNIKRSNMDGTNITVIHKNVKDPYWLTVEWNSLQLYWTVGGDILVSDFEGNNKRVFNCSQSHFPIGIALDPHEGVMFWTESRYTGVPKVVKSNLDGTQCVALVASSLTNPLGITLDRRNKVVFWVDFSTGDIECVDYGGNNRRLLVTFPRTSHLWGVTFTSSYLFVTSLRNCHKVDASNGSVVRKFPIKPAVRSYGLIAFDSSLQASVITCPTLPTPPHGTKLGCHWNVMYYGTVCHFSCNDGFIGSGSQERRCQRNGTWTGQDFGCQAVTCPLPTNAVFLGCNTNATEMLKVSECRFSCKEGFEANNSAVRRCNKNGRWSGLELVCRGMITENSWYL